MSSSRILILGAVVMLLYLAIPYGLRLFFPRVTVGYEKAISGRVTGHFQSRHYYGFFLDGNQDINYDFGDFEPAPASARPDTTGAVPPNAAPDTDLNEYLKNGDVLSKKASSTELIVRRGDSRTRWTCPPAELAH